MAAIINNTVKYWENGIVPYRFDDAAYPASSKQRCIVTKAMDEIQLATNVRFITQTIEKDYIIFTTANGWCSSALGKQGGGQNIGCDITSGAYGVGSIVHELMHALGYIHEHQRTDRNNYVTINETNVKRGFDFFIFPEETQNITEYDYGSIMHYPQRIANQNLVISPDVDTIKATKPIPIDVILGQRGTLSAKDIEGINAIYTTQNAAPVTIDCSIITIEDIAKDYSSLLAISFFVLVGILLYRKFR